VHQVIGGGPMPAYTRRPPDELLRAVLDLAVPASRMVVVRGGSSTGKTRAAYEAVADRLAGWQLDYPLDPRAGGAAGRRGPGPHGAVAGCCAQGSEAIRPVNRARGGHVILDRFELAFHNRELWGVDPIVTGFR
jgi:hypothetical protein